MNEACVNRADLRLRPVLMPAITTAPLGLVPLLLSRGTGSEGSVDSRLWS